MKKDKKKKVSKVTLDKVNVETVTFPYVKSEKRPPEFKNPTYEEVEYWVRLSDFPLLTLNGNPREMYEGGKVSEDIFETLENDLDFIGKNMGIWIFANSLTDNEEEKIVTLSCKDENMGIVNGGTTAITIWKAQKAGLDLSKVAVKVYVSEYGNRISDTLREKIVDRVASLNGSKKLEDVDIFTSKKYHEKYIVKFLSRKQKLLMANKSTNIKKKNLFLYDIPIRIVTLLDDKYFNVDENGKYSVPSRVNNQAKDLLNRFMKDIKKKDFINPFEKAKFIFADMFDIMHILLFKYSEYIDPSKIYKVIDEKKGEELVEKSGQEILERISSSKGQSLGFEKPFIAKWGTKKSKFSLKAESFLWGLLATFKANTFRDEDGYLHWIIPYKYLLDFVMEPLIIELYNSFVGPNEGYCKGDTKNFVSTKECWKRLYDVVDIKVKRLQQIKEVG